MPSEADTVAHGLNCQSLSTFRHNGQTIGFALGHTCGLLLDITPVRLTHLLSLIFRKITLYWLKVVSSVFLHLHLSAGVCGSYSNLSVQCLVSYYKPAKSKV